MTPRILKNMNAFVNGRGFQGRVDEIELPEIATKLEAYRAGGMDGEVELDMGMDAMSGKLSVADPDADLLRLIGLAGANTARVEFRGAFVRDMDNATIAVVAELGGRFKKLSFGTWKAGEKSSQEFEVAVNYFRLTVDGTEICEIDVENMVRRIGGVDQLAAQRNAIGI